MAHYVENIQNVWNVWDWCAGRILNCVSQFLISRAQSLAAMILIAGSASNTVKVRRSACTPLFKEQ